MSSTSIPLSPFPRAAVGRRAARAIRVLSTSLLLVSSTVVQAQAPILTALSPTRNAVAAPRTTTVAATFSQLLNNTPATQQAVRVFSQQAGGRKAGTTTVTGNTPHVYPSH